jgi:hypothetical protein
VYWRCATPGLDRPNLLEPHFRGPEAVKEASAAAEEDGHHVEFELVLGRSRSQQRRL